MKPRSLIALSAMTVGLALSGHALAAPTISDYSFESPTTSGYSYGDPGDGAVFTGGAGVAANGSAFGYANAPDGNQVAHLQNVGTASLTVSGLTVGETYTFSFMDASRPSYGVAPIDVSFAGTSLGTYTPGSASFTQVTTNSFVADATGGVLSFSVNQNTGADINSAVDDVTINGDAVSAAPEPGTWALMMLGVAGLGAALRFRRRETASLTAA